MSLAGTWEPTPIQAIHSGPGCLSEHLVSAIERVRASSADSSPARALIITGKTLATRTLVIKKVEEILQKAGAHAATFTDIGQHAPIEGIEHGVSLLRETGANVLISIGGGSPIDAAKAISKYNVDKHGVSFTPIISIPTTLSAAELTPFFGLTNEKKEKTVGAHMECVAKVIIYDAELTRDTPEKLWLSTGMRALDHAIENQYRKDIQWIMRKIAVQAAYELADNLKKSKGDPDDLDVRTKLQLASALSLFPNRILTPIGLSHALGYAIGSPYDIPHGMCTCLILPGVTKLSVYADLIESKIDVAALNAELGLTSKLSDYGVPREDLEGIAQKTLEKLRGGGVELLPEVEEVVDLLRAAY